MLRTIKKTIKEKELLDVVLSSKEILNESSWEIQNTKSLIALISSTNKHKILSEILQKDYHMSFSNNQFSLYFSDYDIHIQFYNETNLIDFIKNNQIIIDDKYLKNEIKCVEKNIINEQMKLEKLKDEIERINGFK